MTSTDTVGLR